VAACELGQFEALPYYERSLAHPAENPSGGLSTTARGSSTDVEREGLREYRQASFPRAAPRASSRRLRSRSPSGPIRAGGERRQTLRQVYLNASSVLISSGASRKPSPSTRRSCRAPGGPPRPRTAPGTRRTGSLIDERTGSSTPSSGRRGRASTIS
jgi:hypothetical protein